MSTPLRILGIPEEHESDSSEAQVEPGLVPQRLPFAPFNTEGRRVTFEPGEGEEDLLQLDTLPIPGQEQAESELARLRRVTGELLLPLPFPSTPPVAPERSPISSPQASEGTEENLSSLSSPGSSVSSVSSSSLSVQPQPVQPQINMADAIEHRRQAQEAAELLRASTYTYDPYSEPLNLSKSGGQALYESGCEALDVKYDGKGANLSPLIGQLKLKAQNLNWRNILTMDVNMEQGGPDQVNLLEHPQRFNDEIIAFWGTRFRIESAKDAVPGAGPHVAATAAAVPTRTVAAPTGVAGTAAYLALSNDPDAIQEYKDKVRRIQNRQMLFNCLKNSFTAKYKKSIAAKLVEFDDDGVALLHYLYKTSYTTSTLTVRDLKKELQNLSLKDHGFSPPEMHKRVDNIKLELRANEDDLSPNDEMMYLLEAYKKHDHEKFGQHVTNCESQWSTGTMTTPDQLRTHIEQYYTVLQQNDEWKPKRTSTKKSGKTSMKHDEERTALTSEGKADTHEDRKKKWLAKQAKWKLKRGGSDTTKEVDGKTYHWCNGPGHYGVSMWVLHDPDDCKKQHSGTKSGGNTAEAGAAASSKSSAKVKLSKSKFRANLTEKFESRGVFHDDMKSLIDSIVEDTYN